MSLSTPKSVAGMFLTANPTQLRHPWPKSPTRKYPHADRKEAYLREKWVLTSAEAWERPSATAANHWSLAVLRCDHWLRTLRCAADLHSLSDDEGDGDGEAAAGWGGRVGVAAEVSIDSKGFALLCLLACRQDRPRFG